VIGLTFEGANPDPVVTGTGRLAGVSNYLRGSDPDGWLTGVPNYSRVTYRELYDGVDLEWYANRAGEVEFDLTLAPGVDPAGIRLSYTGAERLVVDGSGALVVHADGSQLRQAPPVVYQQVDGVKREVRGRYLLHGDHRVGFALAGYDTTLPLVIDPVITYSTYLGGSGDDEPIWSDIDRAGNFYVTGITFSPDFPVTPGAFQPTYGGGEVDAWVAKLNKTGSALVYSTYLGGSALEFVADLTVDRSGSAYIPGDTNSEDFPTTPGAFQPTFGGGDSDGYVTKRSPSGTRAVYSTYLGGSGPDAAGSVRVNRDGIAHVPGITGSADFPVTPGAFQPSYGGGPTDAYLVLLNRSGSQVKFGSYLGGSGEDGSSGAGSWLDGKGNYFIPGFTDSTDFPVTPGAFQTENGGAFDVFLVKVDLGKRYKGSGHQTASVTAREGTSSGPRAGLTRDRVGRLR
jgi:hypothetical protein